MPGTSRASASAPAPRYARPFVVTFLAALAVCASVGMNTWPFSNWELFSRLRTDRQTRWEEVSVDAGGRTHDLFVAAPPAASSPAAFVAVDHSERWAPEYGAICSAWLRLGSGQLGRRTRLVRIYYLEWLLTDRHGEHAAPPIRTLELTCNTQPST
jgi:hypothetical protein